MQKVTMMEGNEGYDGDDEALADFDMMDLDLMVKEVVLENPPAEQGLREAWLRHEGIGRKECIHCKVPAGSTLPSNYA